MAVGVSLREKEILILAANGMSDTGIARFLSISPRTVAVHMRNIRAKLDASNRTHAVVQALCLGLIDPVRPAD